MHWPARGGMRSVDRAMKTLYHGAGPEIGELAAPNTIRDERERAGIATSAELAGRAGIDPVLFDEIESGRILATKDELDRICAALGGIDVHRLYRIAFLQLLGADPKYSKLPPAKLIRAVGGAKELFVAKDEMLWSEKRSRPDEPVEVFLSMSCGTQAAPHLLLDTVAVCEALGISFYAAAGPAGCCGKPYAANRMDAVMESWSQQKTQFALDIGAREMVVWCTACQQNATTLAARRAVTKGVSHPIRETQTLTFLAERVRAMGERVPWKREVPRRVLAEGHDRTSNVHANALRAEVELMSAIPGVSVVGIYDGFEPDSPCAGAAREESYGTWRRDETSEDIAEHRVILADMAAARGADTVACQHQGCHMAWGRYASDRLAVRHPVSILAEALGVDHPDRYQAASRLGDPREIVEQTRPVWTTWGLSDERALELAKLVADPRYAAGVTSCGCGKGDGCAESLISIDVLTGKAPGLH